MKIFIHYCFLGIVDSSVYTQEVSRNDWEGFENATKAAISGGVTTIFDMPMMGEPHITTSEALITKQTSAQNNIYCDLAFIGLLNQTYMEAFGDKLKELIEEGVHAFKCFLNNPAYGIKGLKISFIKNIIDEIANVEESIPVIIDSEKAIERLIYMRSP